MNFFFLNRPQDLQGLKSFFDSILPFHPCQLFAFNYYSAITNENKDIKYFDRNGWALYNTREESKRMDLEKCRWRISSVNSTFKVCFFSKKSFIYLFSFIY